MADPTPEQVLALWRPEIEKRARWSAIVNMVSLPTDDEVDAAIYDAVEEINSFAPETSYTIVDIHTNTDARWKMMAYLGAAKNVVQMLLFDWTANGLTVQLDEVNLEDKLSNYRDLGQLLSDKFTSTLEKLKFAKFKHSHYKTYSTIPTVYYSSLRRYWIYRNSRYG